MNATNPLAEQETPLREPPAPPRRRLSRTLQASVIVLVLAILGIWMGFGGSPEKPATVVGSPAGTSDSFKPTAEQWAGLKTAAVGAHSFPGLVVTDGEIAADDDLNTTVFSPYTGRVTRLFVKAGDKVKVGDPLLEMQAAEFVQAANDLVAALATQRSSKAQLKLAVTTEKRQHDLYFSQGGALKDWQQSQVDLATAQSGFSSAEVALGAARGRLRILGKSDLEVARMETSADPTRFSPAALITAPISGTITQRQVGIGQNIATQGNGGSTPIFSIGNTSRVWLVANVREVDAPQVHVGDDVEVDVLALPGRVFKAKITFVAMSLDQATHRLPIHAEIPDPDNILKPQMFADFRILNGSGNDEPSVPIQAVVYDSDGTHVWMVGPDHTLLIRKITIGRSHEGVMEVLSGLHVGDVVVTSGAVFIDRAADAD